MRAVAVAAAAAALAFCFRCKVALRPCCRGSVKWLLLFCFCLLLLLLLGADLQLALFDIRLLYPLGTRLEMTSSEFSSVQFGIYGIADTVTATVSSFLAPALDLTGEL